MTRRPAYLAALFLLTASYVGAAATLCLGASCSPSSDALSQWGQGCSTQGEFGFGGGGLLICDSSRFRYALRSDVPDGTYGGFVTRPSWFPALRTQAGLPAEDCHLTLSQAPIDPADVTSIVPYGSMVGQHVTPIDHQYIGVAPLALSSQDRLTVPYVPIRAPANGTITAISSLGSPTSMRVDMAHACETLTVFMVVNQLAGVLAPYQEEISKGGSRNLSLEVKAGDVFGAQRDNPLDFAVQDGHTWLSGFAHPFPYASSEQWKPYTADPLLYFTPEISAQYGAKMQRLAEPRSGRLAVDKAGTAAGNWFLEGTIGYGGRTVDEYRNAKASIPGGPVPGKNGYSWNHLSLAPHWVDPSVWYASIGAWSDPAGDFKQFTIRPGPPDPEHLTFSDGIAVYELAMWSPTSADGGTINMTNPPIGFLVQVAGPTLGVLAVRVNNDNTLTVEKRPDITRASDFSGFSNRAEKYWR